MEDLSNRVLWKPRVTAVAVQGGASWTEDK